jgi:hypothetical protein
MKEGRDGMSFRSDASVKEEGRKMNHGAVGDETDEGVRGEHAQADDEDVSQGLEVVGIETGVDDVEEDWRDGRRPGEGVFDRGVFGEELWGKVVGSEVFVVGREAGREDDPR